MVSIDTGADARELLELAREIAEQEPMLTWREALHHACGEIDGLLADAHADVRYRPAKVVLFEQFA